MNRALRRLGIPLAAAGLAAVLATAWAWRELTAPFAAWEGPEAIVELPRGLDAGSMLSRLHEAGVIRSPRLLRAWLGLRGGAGTLQAGEYRFARADTPLAVLERLARGDVVLHSVTLPEGLTLAEVASRIEQAGLAPAASMLEAFRDPAPLHAFHPVAEDLEGYLFPDTYHFPRTEAPSRIAGAMVERFLETVGPEFPARAAAVGLEPAEAVVLASMIEKETSLPEERGRVSRVFHNRLQRGMRLQCDPTVRYALERAGRPVERLLQVHLTFESPWNTYANHGLPPGPICSPGKASLEAAVDPPDGDDLYFVAAPGGGHRFSRDLAAHRAAVREWRRYRSSR